MRSRSSNMQDTPMRRNYELTETDVERLTRMEPDARDAAWDDLGRRLGFDPSTVRSLSATQFSAVPTERTDWG